MVGYVYRVYKLKWRQRIRLKAAQVTIYRPGSKKVIIVYPELIRFRVSDPSETYKGLLNQNVNVFIYNVGYPFLETILQGIWFPSIKSWETELLIKRLLDSESESQCENCIISGVFHEGERKAQRTKYSPGQAMSF